METHNNNNNNNKSKQQTQPRTNDVICGRGKSIANHPGNKLLKTAIKQHIQPYQNASSKTIKSMLVSNIVDSVRSKGGDFVKLNTRTGQYDTATERIAREKVGQYLRDALHTVYKSASKCKKIKRGVDEAALSGRVLKLLMSNETVSSMMTSMASLADSDVADSVFFAASSSTNWRILEEMKKSNMAALVSDSESDEDM